MTDPLSSTSISSASVPSGAGAVPPSTPTTHSSEPGTPFSVGYRPDPDNESQYSPPMASALLPGEPQTVEFMILTEYITSMFKQVGKNGKLPNDEERHSMQKFLIAGNYSREDMEAGFLHAVQIVCKALRAFNTASAEVANSNQASSVAEVQLGEAAAGFRVVSDTIGWEDVSLNDTHMMQTTTLQRGVLRAYSAVAEIKIGMMEVFRRQTAVEAKTDSEKDGADVEMDEDEYEPNDDISSIKGEDGSAGSAGSKQEEDRMEVDSAYGA